MIIKEDSFSTIPTLVKFRTLRRRDKEDYILSIIALAQFPLVFVQLLLISFGWDSEATTIYRVILSAGSILSAFPVIIKRKSGVFVGFYLMIGVLYLIHFICFPDTIEYWHENGFRFLIPICIPTLLCMLSIKDVKFFYIAIKQICYVTAACGLVFGVRLITGMYDAEDNYFMTFGFLMLLPVIVFFLEGTWYTTLLSLLFFIFIIAFGSRGPLLSIATFVSYYIIRKKKYLLLILIIIIAIVGFTVILSYLDSVGISSRTIQMLLNGDIMSDSGRDDIRVNIFRGIQENPLLGNGMFGDRALSNGYAHNFFIEVICHFGFIFGGILLIRLLYDMLYVMLRLRGYHKDFFVAMMCILFIPLMTSGSYLQEPNFFVFIGFLVLMKRQIRRERKLQVE